MQITPMQFAQRSTGVALIALTMLWVAPTNGKNLTTTFRKGSVLMLCAFGKEVNTPAKGEPCRLYYGQKNDATGHPKDSDIYQWRTRAGRVITFVGRHDDRVPWWFGRLNGKAASGFDLNWNHYVFASSDGELEFECWIPRWGLRNVPSR